MLPGHVFAASSVALLTAYKKKHKKRKKKNQKKTRYLFHNNMFGVELKFDMTINTILVIKRCTTA